MLTGMSAYPTTIRMSPPDILSYINRAERRIP